VKSHKHADALKIVLSALITIIFCACSSPEKKIVADVPVLPKVSPETETILKNNFPGAMTAPEMSDSVLRYLNRKYGIRNNELLLGVSTCVDDIIYTKNFHLHPDIKGPFHLGGLAGLPFTGVLGLKAFAHHVPDGGSMLLLIEPHVGYSAEKGWGYILRHDQHELSSCCGALTETLKELKEGKLTGVISDDDYQGGKIAELALEHKEEILSADNPIIELTKVTSKEAERQIRSHLDDMAESHPKYIIVLTGVMINTDYSFTDYQYIDHFMIYDVAKKAFLEDLHIKL
jgi:hypothetical protein